MILRPSVVFGPEDEFFNRFGALAAHLPSLPLLGGGKTRLQPVYAGDVGQAAAAALAGAARPGAIYELGGPQIMTLREAAELTLRDDRPPPSPRRHAAWPSRLIASVTSFRIASDIRTVPDAC